MNIVLTINLRVDTLLLEDNKVEEWECEVVEKDIKIVIIIIIHFLKILFV